MKKLSLIFILVFSCSVAWGESCQKTPLWCEGEDNHEGLCWKTNRPMIDKGFSPVPSPDVVLSGKIGELQKEIELLKDRINELEETNKKEIGMLNIHKLRLDNGDAVVSIDVYQGSGVRSGYIVIPQAKQTPDFIRERVQILAGSHAEILIKDVIN